ncbi:predicted protein [Uncinocarpus reesii 1704]|uniref:Uncharacterized protein n=1 Tax=Uncinocarpus reesii (strain UAMH 1704) TaxID=336963 RepID=C4JW30_UNCRE|nr:uncharacterized protein UREG_06772 [Uncinocarpus reesii 1704]EEP81907.1 predicted protein [Uncinocarpus reesii 1704]
MSSASSMGSNDSYILPSTTYDGPRSVRVFWPEKYGAIEHTTESGPQPLEEPAPAAQGNPVSTHGYLGAEKRNEVVSTYQEPSPSFEERKSRRRQTIVEACSKVYGIAKVVLEIQMAVGAVIDSTPTGIKFYIDRVENIMAHKSCSKLLGAVEDLYYATYATLNIEIKNVELCEGFHFDIRSLAPNNKFNAKECLPEPSHLRLIFQACKDYLASDNIRHPLHREIIRRKQAEYVYQTVKMSRQAGHVPENEEAFRQYIQNMVTNPESPYCRQWTGLCPIYDAAPAMVLGTLSEKYLSVLAKEEKREQIKFKKQTAERHSTDSAHEEWRHITSNREAAYAMLHGMPVGEYRRQEGKMALSAYVKENLCICFGYCECSRRCTLKGGRKCPCSSRLSVICDAHNVDEKECFIEKCADIAAAVFDRLSAVRRGASVFQMATELDMRLDRFHEAVVEYRQQSEKASSDDGSKRRSDF